MTLDILLLVKEYAQAFNALSGLVASAQEQHNAIDTQYRPRLLAVAKKLSAAETELTAAIVTHPDQFKKPRTQEYLGIKFGLAKSRPALTWSDPDDVVARIQFQFKKPEDYLHTKVSPNREAIAELPDAVLYALGITKSPERDIVVIKPIDSATEKLVNTILATLPTDQTP